MSYVAQAQAQYAEAVRQSKENADAYKKSISEIFDNQKEQTQKQADSDIKKLDSQYKGLYDEAALQQLVNERNLKQKQASLGLTDSGLTASQQTAIQVSRGNANAKISAQKQAAVDSITVQLEQYLAQIEQNRANSFAEVDYNLNANNTNLYNTLMSQAYSNQAALDAANAQAAATIEAARIAAEQEAASALKTNVDTYYERAKYLLENNSAKSAIDYIESLDLDVADRARLRMSLGLSQTPDPNPVSPVSPVSNVIEQLRLMNNYNDKIRFLSNSLKNGTITQGEYNRLAYSISGRSR